MKINLSNDETEKLARWFDEFNSWEWPKDYPVYPPGDWEKLPDHDKNKEIVTKYNISLPYITAIRNVIGQKEILRYHHIHNIGVKNYQFEIWWFFRKIDIMFNRFIDVYTLLGWRKI
jgi:hypothetical protein